MKINQTKTNVCGSLRYLNIDTPWAQGGCEFQVIPAEVTCVLAFEMLFSYFNKWFRLNIFHVIKFKPSNSAPAAPILRITSFNSPEHYFISWIFYMPDCCQWLHYLPFQFIELNWNNVKVAISKQKTCYMVMIRNPLLSSILQVVW